MLCDTIIETRWVLPIVPKGEVWENRSVIISGGIIAAIEPTESARRRWQAPDTVSLPESLVMPGFVDLHTHAAMNLLRGRGADLPLMEWLNTAIWPAEGKLMSADFVREGSYLAGREMAMSGITCASDQYFFPEDAAEGLRKAGLRCAVAGIVIGFPSAWAKNDAEYLDKCEALLRNHRSDPLVHATVGPHAPYTVKDETLRRCAELSERYGAPIHMHVGETATEVADSLKKFGKRPLARLKRVGILNERLIAVHSVHSDDADIAMMAAAHCSVCHCPSSNLKLASGFAPVQRYLDAGINLGIGTDGAASNDKLDMLGETRLAAMLAKAVAGRADAARVYDMLEAATLGGARALGWDSEIGSLENGKAADLIAVDLSHENCLPVTDPAAQLLYAADRENVSHVWVAGDLVAFRPQQYDYLNKKASFEMKTLAKKWQNMP